MGRRAFLTSLVGTGVGAGVARLRITGGSPAGGETSIVYGIGRADEDDPSSLVPLTKSVPTDWYDELIGAFDAHRALPLGELAGFVGSFVVPGDASDPSASIAIQSTAGGVREELTDLPQDVPLDVEVLDDIPEPSGETSIDRPRVVADFDDRSVPGGVFCGNEAMRGSLAPALRQESTGAWFFATANHLYGGSGPDQQGEPLYLVGRNERSRIGRSWRGFPEEDVVLAEPSDEYVPTSKIRGASPGTVAGQFTKLGLADLLARGEPLEMTGAVSGHTSGQIKGIDGVTFFTGHGVRTGQLLWGDESTFTDGDSGSVNYQTDPHDDGRLLVGGMNSARTWWPGSNFTWGTAAYRIRDVHGLVF